MPDTVSTVLDWHTERGLLAYPEAIARMAARVAAIRAGTAAEAVWLVEHPPLYTAGTSARPDELRDPDRFPTFSAGRGGQWTYHGPGQRIAYVMLDLNRRHGLVPPRDVRGFVAALESWVIGTLAQFGIAGERRAGRVGIWVVDPVTRHEAKIAAIGVRVTRWVTWHGIAINIAPELDHFAGIVPCGIIGHGVTSLAAQRVAATMDQIDTALRTAWSEIFDDAA